MSNEKQETIEDIVKELREIKGGQHTNGGLSFERWRARCQFADDYADRIEAAAKRECEATSEKSSQVGNAAKMREALYEITLIDTRMLKRLLCELVEADIFDGGQIRNTIHAVEKARQAISAPPRNCDLYRTKKELDAAYEKYREYVIMSNSNPFVAKDEMMTKEDWLFAEEKGEAK